MIIFNTMAELCRKMLRYTGLYKPVRELENVKYSMEYIGMRMQEDTEFIRTVSTEQLVQFIEYCDEVEDFHTMAQALLKNKHN